jgi:LuxR family transcriptional regulator, maltose regulon positive regulatory protein
VKKLTPPEALPLDGKFRAPRLGADALHRDRLHGLIDQAVARSVTVITAPAGAGKTVACATWAAARAGSRRIAWLSLDERDRDPAGFWADVTAALAAGGTATAAAGLLVPRSRGPGDDGPPVDLLDTVRKLAGSVVLVIDDVHVLAGSEALPGLALLVHRAPAALRLILCGRSVPGLHLAKMRLDGTLAEIGAIELACTAGEAETYFARLGLAIATAERGQLLRQTDGWMAGLGLAALISRRDGDLSVGAVSADPIVADYMRDEVLDQQPSRIRQFLRRTSIATRISGDLAERLTGERGSASILDRLDRQNCFVSRDHDGGYQYHSFMRQVLLTELRCELPQEVPVLLGRAARWYASRGDVLEAVRCSAGAQDWDHASQALTEAGLAAVLPDRMSEFEAVLGLFPAARRAADPAVSAALAITRMCLGDPESAAAYSRLTTRVLDEHAPNRLVIELWLAAVRMFGQPDAETLALCLTVAENAQAYASRIAEHQALGLLWLSVGTAMLRTWKIAEARLALGLAQHQLTAAGVAGLLARAQGWQALAEALYGDLSGAAELIAKLRDRVPAEPAALCLADLAAAQLAIEQDDLLSAAKLLNDADGATVAWLPGEPDVATLRMLTRARIALADEDTAEACDITRQLREQCDADAPAVVALEVDIAVQSGDATLAAAVLGAPDGGPEPPDRLAARARLLLANGDPAAALETARACVSPATLRDRVTSLLAAAVASRRLGADDEAAFLLEEALIMAEPHNAFRPFLDMGGAVHTAIDVLLSPASPAAAFAARVRERFICQSPSGAAATGPSRSEVPALTASELAVLRLLRSHLTNQEIAEALFLSVNTVKTHLRSVYRKLGVQSRREAVDSGRRLQLLLRTAQPHPPGMMHLGCRRWENWP